MDTSIMYDKRFYLHLYPYLYKPARLGELSAPALRPAFSPARKGERKKGVGCSGKNITSLK